MVKTLAVAALLCLAAGAADAKQFKIGEGATAATIDIPDSWSPSEIDDGVEATSPDKETYVAAEAVEADDLTDAAKAEGKFFKKQKIVLKTDTEKKRDIKLGALEGIDFSWDATDADGPTHVSMTVLVLSEKKFVMLTYWGSPAGEKSNGKDLGTIANSIKPAK